MVGWRASLVRTIARRVFAAPGKVVAGAVVLAVLSVLYTVHNLQFRTDRDDLVSANSSQLHLAQQRIRDFGERDGFVVVIENRNRAESMAVLAALARRLESDTRHFVDVFYRIDPRPFAHRGLLYLGREELLALREHLLEHWAFIEGLSASPDLTAFFRLANQRLSAGLVGELFTGFLREEGKGPVASGPLDLGFLVAALGQVHAWLNGSRTYTSPWDGLFPGTPRKALPDGYLWTAQERFLLILVTPRKDERSFNRAKEPLERLRAAIVAVKIDYPGVAVGVTGKEALEADEMTAALRDTSLATVISLAGLGLLLVLFLGGISRPILAVVTLTIALCWTFGAATLLVGHLNILSVVFTPLLLGLGIDYGIHVLARHEEERRRGRSVRVALHRALEAAGPGIMNAAVAAAASFLALALTDFQGLRELGIITGMGLLLALAATLVVLPALVLLKERGGGKAAPSGLGVPPGKHHPLLAFAWRWPGLVVAAGLMAAGLSLGAVGRVGFDLNPLRLQTAGAESVVWELKLLSGSERSTVGEIVARSLDEVGGKTAALLALPTVARVESVLTFLPGDQEEKLEILRGLRPAVQDVAMGPDSGRPLDLGQLTEALDRIRSRMGEAKADDASPWAGQRAAVRALLDAIHQRLAALGPAVARERVAAFESAFFRDLADRIHAVRDTVLNGPMTAEDLPDTLRRRFIGQSGHYLIRVYPKEDVWEAAPLERFVTDLRSVTPDVLGEPVSLHLYLQAFRQAYERAAVYALIAMFVLVLIDFRAVGHAILAMSPLLVGAVWTVGLMWLFRVQFNVANVIFLPLIVGAGVENGIMILHRWREEGEAFQGVPASTGKGVALASFTTIVGFGSLMVSDHRGVYSLGLLLTLGTACVLVASLTVLPALLRLRSGRRPAPYS